MDDDIKTFLFYSGTYMDINGLGADWEQHFVDAINSLDDNDPDKASFRRGFAKSIRGGLTPGKYEHATSWDFDTDEEFREHLLKYWRIFYGSDDPASAV